MQADDPGARPRTPYVDFRHSRLYFGWKIWLAAALAIGVIFTYASSDSDTPEGRIALGITVIIGVVIGLLLQPGPKPKDHRPRARQALQNVATGIELIIDVQTVAATLPESDPENVSLGVTVATLSTDLTRARKHLTSSMADWDEVAPGAVAEFRRSQRRAIEILTELALEEGRTDG